ncbi:hypothetical protein BaRGS_00031863, partial [Batillaria attramentaria]
YEIGSDTDGNSRAQWHRPREPAGLLHSVCLPLAGLRAAVRSVVQQKKLKIAQQSMLGEARWLGAGAAVKIAGRPGLRQSAVQGYSARGLDMLMAVRCGLATQTCTIILAHATGSLNWSQCSKQRRASRVNMFTLTDDYRVLFASDGVSGQS